MAERHQYESGIGDQSLRRAGKQAHHKAAAPTDAAEVLDAAAQHERHQQQSGPEEAMESEIRGGKSDGDAMFGGDEAGSPAERRADTAQGADQDAGRLCRRRLRLIVQEFWLSSQVT